MGLAGATMYLRCPNCRAFLWRSPRAVRDPKIPQADWRAAEPRWICRFCDTEICRIVHRKRMILPLIAMLVFGAIRHVVLPLAASNHYLAQDAISVPGWVSQLIFSEIGRASCRERVCTFVYISVVAVSIKKQTH